ncbi:hypothetical protein CYG49_04250, partial [Candidatus Saccharibacteria bacterium]
MKGQLMLDRMNNRAMRVVYLTASEAQAQGCQVMNVRHLLLALLREGDGVAAEALQSFGVTHEGARKLAFGQILPSLNVTVVAPDNDITSLPVHRSPELKSVFSRTLFEACNMGHTYIGTEHLLLALISRVGGGNDATTMLIQLGAPPDEVRREVIRLLTGYPPER